MWRDHRPAAARDLETASEFLKHDRDGLYDGGQAVFRRDGDYWTILFDGRLFRMRHVKGLACLAYLLGHPATEVHCSSLAAVMERLSAGPDSAGGAIAGGAGDSLGDAGPMLDSHAKADYRRRLSELREELEEAREMNDFARATSLEEETDFITAEISRAGGRGGRDRRASSAKERARLNVTKAIKAVLAKIAQQNRNLGDHLAATIRTGTFCSYRPDPTFPTSWKLG